MTVVDVWNGGAANALRAALRMTNADEEYVAATRNLISLLRLHSDSFPRVQDENINYGFLRNMLGLKPVALTILFACYLLDLYAAGLLQSAPGVLVSFVTNLVLTFVWLLYITANRVLEAARLYADRLFECIATPGLLAQGDRDRA